MKNSPRQFVIPPPNISWHYALWQVVYSWHTPNPDLSVGLPAGEAWFITQENAFPLLQSPMAASFTPLHHAQCKALADLRLVCGCSAMETPFMKLPTNSYYADVASRGSWELGSECCNWGQIIFYSLCASTLGGPVLWACVAYHFTAEPLLLLDVSNSQ
jgi:hypothetical protein